MIRALLGIGPKLRTAALVWFAIDATIGLILLTQPAITDGLLTGVKSLLGQAFLAGVAAIGAQS